MKNPLIAVVLLPAALLSQTTAPTEVFARVPIHTAEPDRGIEYGLWGAGESYKASFHGDVTFVPYLGFEYPRTQSLAWHTESIRVGGVELLAAEPERFHTDYRFELRSGAVTEAYDLRLDGLEQTFVLHRRPAMLGDFVVRERVATDLTAAPFASERRAIDFFDTEGRKVLAYGIGTVVDADGTVGPVLTSFDGERVTLRVSGSLLRDAKYPVVLDPLIHNTLISSGVPRRSPDIARSSLMRTIMMCYTKAASVSDKDAFAMIMTDVFTSVSTAFADLSPNYLTERIQVAVTGDVPQRYGVAFDRYVLGGQRHIRVHLHRPNDFNRAKGMISLYPPFPNDNDWRVDIGGCELNPSSFGVTGHHFLIVWQRDRDPIKLNSNESSIMARRLHVNGTIGRELTIAVGGAQLGDNDRPSVNQQASWVGSIGGRTEWMVAYQHSPAFGTNALDHWRIRGRQVDDQDNVNGLFTYGDSTQQFYGPKVAGRAGRYLVVAAYSPFSLVQFRSGFDRGHGVRALRVDWTWGQQPIEPHPLVDVSTVNTRRLQVGGAAFDWLSNSHWAVTYNSDRTIGGTGRTYASRLGYSGGELEAVTTDIPNTSTGNGEAGGTCFDDDSDSFVIGWTMNTLTSGHAEAVRYSYESVAAPQVSGVSCSTASIDWSGSQQIGSEFGRVRLSNAVGGQLAILVAALQPQDINLLPVGLPGCRLLVSANGYPGFLGTFTTVTAGGGYATFDMPLPEWLPSLDFYFQWFHLDAGPTGPIFVSTQRIGVPVVR